jgi:erythromycin esterase-like protein
VAQCRCARFCRLAARAQRSHCPRRVKVGFYGLDLYSLYSSIEAILAYLRKIDPEAAKRPRQRYSCFEDFGEDSQAYGYATSSGLAESCEDEVVGQLLELRQRAAEYARRDGRVAEDEFFYVEQNARLVKNAEQSFHVSRQSLILEFARSPYGRDARSARRPS